MHHEIDPAPVGKFWEDTVNAMAMPAAGAANEWTISINQLKCLKVKATFYDDDDDDDAVLKPPVWTFEVHPQSMLHLKLRDCTMSEFLLEKYAN